MNHTDQAFNAIAILLSFAAIASYVNHRFIRFPQTIALMALSLSLSLIVVFLGTVEFIDPILIKDTVASLHFDEVLLH